MRIGLGCMALTGIYGAVPQPQAIATVHAALDNGIRMFDTAPLYGSGENERLIGAVLANRGDVFVVTKFGLAERKDGKLARDSRPASIRTSVDASLRRLKRERIDLLLQHRQDPDVDDDEVAATAAELCREGKIGAFGLSATTAQRAKEISSICQVRAVQNEHSLLAPDTDIAMYGQMGAMFMAYAPLGRGLLASDKWQNAPAPDDLRANMVSFGVEQHPKAASLNRIVAAIAAQNATSRVAVALAWVLSKSSHVVAIPGAKSPEQVQVMTAARSLKLLPDKIADLDSASRPS